MLKKELKKKKLIGSGSFCDVYKYFDEKSNKYYACKKLRSQHRQNDDYKNRLKKEIEFLKELSDCNNIVNLIDSSSEDNNVWYLMEYAEDNLFKYIQKNNQKLSKEDRFEIIEQVINAIKFSHSKGILHRDISPSNVLVFNDNGQIKIKVTDFGLGKNQESLSYYTHSSVSGYGQILYVAPEQHEKLKNATKQSDIFSLGKLIYFIWTGKNPNNMKSSELPSLISKSIEENIQDRLKNIDELEKHYITFKDLQTKSISQEYRTLNDMVEESEPSNWVSFHRLVVSYKDNGHPFHDYIHPILSILNSRDKITDYHDKIGSDMITFCQKLSDGMDNCSARKGWDFKETKSFGNLLVNIIKSTNNNDVKLICFKQLWNLAYIGKQWNVQDSLKKIFNISYINNEIELSLAEYIGKHPLKIDISSFKNISKVLKNGIIQSSELFEANKKKKIARSYDIEDKF